MTVYIDHVLHSPTVVVAVHVIFPFAGAHQVVGPSIERGQRSHAVVVRGVAAAVTPLAVDGAVAAVPGDERAGVEGARLCRDLQFVEGHVRVDAQPIPVTHDGDGRVVARVVRVGLVDAVLQRLAHVKPVRAERPFVKRIRGGVAPLSGSSTTQSATLLCFALELRLYTALASDA